MMRAQRAAGATGLDLPSWLSDDVLVALAPTGTYQSLVAEDVRGTWSRVVRQVVPTLVTLAFAISVVAIERITLGLVASMALCWAFVLVIQAGTGAVVVAAGRAQPVVMARALELWFAAGLPYGLWLLGLMVWAMASRELSLGYLIASAVMPASWTALIVHAFCRVVLGATSATSLACVVAHQAMTWLIAMSLAAWASGGWFQMSAAIERALR